MLQPRDICSPEKIQKNSISSPYLKFLSTLGKAEYEMIAQRIVEESQKANRWLELPETSFATLFRENMHSFYLENLVRDGGLEKSEKGYRLTEEAINLIAKKYPTNNSQ